MLLWTFCVFGSCCRMLAIILVSQFCTYFLLKRLLIFILKHFKRGLHKCSFVSQEKQKWPMGDHPDMTIMVDLLKNNFENPWEKFPVGQWSVSKKKILHPTTASEVTSWRCYASKYKKVKWNFMKKKKVNIFFPSQIQQCQIKLSKHQNAEQLQ